MNARNFKILSLVLLATFILQIGVYSQNVGEAAPDFTLTTVSGSQFKLSDNAGKVVFIFLFGYNCPHCLANGNNTETGIYSFYKSNSNFVAIGIDTWDGNQSSVENYISQTGLTYPVALNGSSVQSAYNTTYDRIIVIDQAGIIRYKSIADATSLVVNTAKQVIDGLLTPTSVGDLQAETESFSLYPVPARENIFVKSNNEISQGVTINILETGGKLVLTRNINKQSNDVIELPLDGLNSGVYILQVQSSNTIQSKKFVLKR